MNQKREQFDAAVAELVKASEANGHTIKLHSYAGDHARFVCMRCGSYGAIEMTPSAHLCEHSDSNIYPCASVVNAPPEVVATPDTNNDESDKPSFIQAMERATGIVFTEVRLTATEEALEENARDEHPDAQDLSDA